MALQPGEVVILKSGGQPMTVVSVDDENVECVWLGEEGEFFRETMPAVALEAARDAARDESDDDEEEADANDEDADEEREEEASEGDEPLSERREVA